MADGGVVTDHRQVEPKAEEEKKKKHRAEGPGDTRRRKRSRKWPAELARARVLPTSETELWRLWGD